MSLDHKIFYRFGDFTIDVSQRILLQNGKPFPLAPKVFDTLLVLVERHTRIVEKEDLMSLLWPDTFVEEANLTFNIQQVRRALGDNARQPIYIETIPRRGYRFIAAVERYNEAGSVVNEAARSFSDQTVDLINTTENTSLSSANTRDGEAVKNPANYVAKAGQGRFRGNRILIVFTVFGLIAVLSGGGWLLWRRNSAESATPTGKVILAVLPFRNLTGDAGQDYFSDGLTEEMITQLGSIDPQHLGVIALTSVMRYKNDAQPLDQIARDLGVDYVVEGSLRRDQDHVLASTRLIQTRDQTQLWSREYDRESQNAFALQREIAIEVAGHVRSALGDRETIEVANRSPISPHDYKAYDLYLKGQFYWNKRTIEDFQQAIGYFRQAIAEDPNFAPAYVGLADTYALIGGYSMRPQTEYIQQARAAAQKALELDDSSAEAHTAMALIVQNYDWDWERSEQEFRRAIELNSNYATAHHWYAEHLTWLGRFDDALRESDQALKLDPLSLVIATDRGATLYYARQYDRAIEQLRAVRTTAPTHARAGGLLLASYEQAGQHAEAIDEIDKWETPSGIDSPGYWSELAYASGRAGQAQKAQSALDKLLEMNRRQEVDAIAIVWAYLGAGDKKQALSWLQRAYQQHSNGMVSLKVEPRYDPLRSEPEFQEIVREVGLLR